MKFISRLLLALSLAGLFAQPLAAQQLIGGRTPTGRTQALVVTETGGLTANNPDLTPVTFTPGAANNAVLFNVDTTGYRGVSLQLSGTWVATVSFQGSNDGTNWAGVFGVTQSNGSWTASTQTTSVLIYIPASTRYVRAVISPYTSGTVNGTVFLRQTNIDTSSNSVTVNATGSSATQVQGTAATDNVIAGNPLYTGCRASNAVPTAMSADGDAVGFWCDRTGSLVATQYASSLTAVSATNRASTSAEATAGGFAVKASGGNVFSIMAVGAGAGFLMLFNSTTVPADGTVAPALCIPVAANALVSPNISPLGIGLSTGISVAYSSTGCFTKTTAPFSFIHLAFK